MENILPGFIIIFKFNLLFFLNKRKITDQLSIPDTQSPSPESIESLYPKK